MVRRYTYTTNVNGIRKVTVTGWEGPFQWSQRKRETGITVDVSGSSTPRIRRLRGELQIDFGGSTPSNTEGRRALIIAVPKQSNIRIVKK